MLTNAQMTPNRFAKLAKGRKIYRRIHECLAKGGFVRVGTATRYTDFKPKHASLIKLGQSGSLYMLRGKNTDCIDFCSFQFTA